MEVPKRKKNENCYLVISSKIIGDTVTNGIDLQSFVIEGSILLLDFKYFIIYCSIKLYSTDISHILA